MQQLTRIQVIIFAIMLFGAFADFARNEWGNTVIIVCECLVVATFIVTIFTNLQKQVKQEGRVKINKTLTILFCIYFGLSALFIISGLVTAHIQEMPLMLLKNLNFIYILFIPIYLLFEYTRSIVNKTDKQFIKNIWENYLLSCFFISLIMTNLYWNAGNVLRTFSLFFLVIFYLIIVIKFFKHNYKNNKAFTSMFSIVSISVFLLGICLIFKYQPWNGYNQLFYCGVGVFIISIFFFKRKYIFNNENLYYWQIIYTINKNVILVYFLVLIFCPYKIFAGKGIIPLPYSEYYPFYEYKLQNAGERIKGIDLRNTYDFYVEHSKQNSFLSYSDGLFFNKSEFKKEFHSGIIFNYIENCHRYLYRKNKN